MNLLHSCSDWGDAVDLYRPLSLYLKPIARLNVSVQLPQLKTPGKIISNWEVMEKLRVLVKPEEFLVLKVTKSTLEFIRFEGEIENKSRLSDVINRLDSKHIKLSGFSETLKVRAAEAKITFPTRHEWDSYFRDAKHMNEMKPGERPDTIHLATVPCKWFYHRKENTKKPSEHVLRRVFESFGEVRCVDIPIADPYRPKMKEVTSGMKTFSFDQGQFFDAFVQFKEYMCFVKAMTALRGMKLLYRDGEKAWTANIKVDFDRTKHMSDHSMRKRREEREKLIAVEKEKEAQERRKQELEEMQRESERRKQEELEREKMREKAEQRRLRKQIRKEKHEQKRKLRVEKKKKLEEEEINRQIIEEEKKFVIAQRKLEAIRLLDVLLEKLKVKVNKENVEKIEKELENKIKEEKERKKKQLRKKEKLDRQKQRKMELREKLLKEKLVLKYKLIEEQRMEEQREKLRKTVEENNTKLTSVLATDSHHSPGPSKKAKVEVVQQKKDRFSSSSSEHSDKGWETDLSLVDKEKASTETDKASRSSSAATVRSSSASGSDQEDEQSNHRRDSDKRCSKTYRDTQDNYYDDRRNGSRFSSEASYPYPSRRGYYNPRGFNNRRPYRGRPFYGFRRGGRYNPRYRGGGYFRGYYNGQQSYHESLNKAYEKYFQSLAKRQTKDDSQSDRDDQSVTSESISDSESKSSSDTEKVKHTKRVKRKHKKERKKKKKRRKH